MALPKTGQPYQRAVRTDRSSGNVLIGSTIRNSQILYRHENVGRLGHFMRIVRTGRGVPDERPCAPTGTCRGGVRGLESPLPKYRNHDTN
jgi:hypothetical protein